MKWVARTVKYMLGVTVTTLFPDLVTPLSPLATLYFPGSCSLLGPYVLGTENTSPPLSASPLFFFFLNVYLFLKEHKWGRGREREGDTESERLQALSCQHRAQRGA